MSAQTVQGSPTKANRIPTQSNLYAKYDHFNTDRAIVPRPMHGYIEDSKEILQARAIEIHWRGAESAWHAISCDPAVEAALAALLPVLDNADESTHYAPTTKLLNSISLAVYKQLRQKERNDCARIFASNPRTRPGGDYLGTYFMPDYITYLGTRTDLERAVTHAHHQLDMPWAEIDHVGEDKAPQNPDDGMAQLKSYMRTGKGYRPDLTTVHGFRVYRGRITFAQLNACDMWTTSPIDCNTLDPWIAYVVRIYSLNGVAERSPDLRYNAQQPYFVRWDILPSPRRQEYALSPFYVARAPGRNTFASFQIAAGPTTVDAATEAFFAYEVKGFWKLSWQQTSARSKEKQLLQSLHREGWLPGLVRLHENEDEYAPMTVFAHTEPEPSEEDPDASTESSLTSESNAADSETAPLSEAVEPTPAPEAQADESTSSDRMLEILHLASIGEPLSQLESPRALIHAFYDLLETLIHMHERGVLHRDVSWFNVLYKGKHHTSEGKTVLKRPCIEEIMHAVRSSKNPEPSTSQSKQKEFSPCILVTDLDHAIETKLLKESPNAGREKTGTPMFMAVELSDYSAREYPAIRASSLKQAFLETNNIPPAALLVAFPKGDNDFMTRFLAVMKEEAERYKLRPLESPPVHGARHDAESAFWVFFWAAIRALPRDDSRRPSKVELDDFTEFCGDMLAHVIDKDKSDRRDRLLKAASFGRLFHPSLQKFASLFATMAEYLNVPWHYYEKRDMVEPDHAHVAFRRLLLHFEMDVAGSEMLDLKLNTEHPRLTAATGVDSTERAKALQASHLSDVRGSGRPHELAGLSGTGGSTSSKKRKGKEPTDRGTGSSKKASMKKAAAPESAQFSNPDSEGHGAPAPDYSAMAKENYSHATHADRRTAHALRLKFWKDRQLWFSRGE